MGKLDEESKYLVLFYCGLLVKAFHSYKKPPGSLVALLWIGVYLPQISETTYRWNI